MLPLMRRVRPPVLSLSLLMALPLTACAPANTPLYCFADPAQVWGVSPLPADAQPECPDSDTVRGEVRSGKTRIEQFALPADQAETVLKLMQGAGYAVVSRKPDDGIQLEAILRKGGDQVMYFAEHQPGRTFVTLTGYGHGE
ncbi:hypothetical protein GCM10010914_09170 [Deinococcus wulumuqiensis]|uniref:Lipoprotein n=2 Tax=Deinococcus wulumuqiensis TaxID=980427 RepID=A0AAV4K1U3_9DEIO|nr:hypothetical protein GCM10010914_09170 [Deinococcus wulumuqiensis]GGP30709.1 hypothetical protein GCM10008021_23600 [Deinococcus wulumuqiensis]